MDTKQVSHICIIDEDKNIYLDDNERLGGMSFVGGKLEDNEIDDFEKGALRELSQETGGFFNLPKSVLDEIETNEDKIDGVIWEGKLYGFKISKNVGDLLIENQKNIKRVSFDSIEKARISEKLDKTKIINRIQLTIKKILKDE